MVNGAVFAFGSPEGDHLLDDFGNSVRFGANCAGARHATERAHAALHELRFLAEEKIGFAVDKNQGTVALDDLTFARVVERDDGNALRVDVEPDIELSPVREWKNADVFALIDAGVKDVPKFRPLIFGIPLAVGVAEGVDAFLGARFFLVAARSAEGRGKSSGFERIEQRASFQQGT